LQANPAMEGRIMTGGLQKVVYTTLIVGAIGTGGYLVDKTFHLGIKEHIAGALIDNPKDAGKLYMNKLFESNDIKSYQDQVSTVSIQTGKYLDDKTRILTADELVKMTSPQFQESYLDSKLEQLSEDKKVQLAEKTFQTLPMGKILYLVDKMPDSTQNSIVKYVAKERVNEFFDDIKSGMKKAYDSTFGKLGNKE